MLPGNAKCSMTSLADTKHIFRERKIDLFMGPRISQLAKTTRGWQTARALRTRRDYKVATLGIKVGMPLIKTCADHFPELIMA